MYKKFLLMGVLIFAFSVSVLQTPIQTYGQGNPDIDPTFPDVFYVEDGDFKQRLDIYLPDEAEALYPTVLLLHGNGYNKWDMKPLVVHFLAEGYAAIAVEYRNPYPEFPQDVFCALAWTHSNADEYGFDIERIFGLGHSMGGFGATLLGVTDDTELFMENCPHELPEENWIRGIILYAAGGIDSSYPDIEIEQYNLIETVIDSQIDGSEPPFLVLHGTIDRLVRAESSEHFAEKLEAAEVETTLILLEEAGHFFINPESEYGAEAIMYVDEFLETLFDIEESDGVDAD